MKAPLSGQFLEIVELYSAETDDAGLLVTDDYYEACDVAKANRGYVNVRRYKFDGDEEMMKDYREDPEGVEID